MANLFHFSGQLIDLDSIHARGLNIPDNISHKYIF